MKAIIYSMIAAGILIMVTNIYRDIRFMQNMRDAFPKGKNRSWMWKTVGLLLLVFFLMGYIAVAAFGAPDLMVAGILFGGSIFVAIVLTIMFDLIESIEDNCLSVTEVLIGVIVILIDGITFGIMAWLTKGLEASSAIHIVNNMAAFYMTGLGFGQISSEVTLSSVFWVIAINGVYILVLALLGKKFGWFDRGKKDDAGMLLCPSCPPAPF